MPEQLHVYSKKNQKKNQQCTQDGNSNHDNNNKKKLNLWMWCINIHLIIPVILIIWTIHVRDKQTLLSKKEKNIQWIRLVWLGWFMVFNTTFNNTSVISWRSVLLVVETGVPRENNRPVASHWQTLSHNVVSSTLRHERGSNSQL